VTITRIKRLMNYPVFHDFTWPSELPDFGRYTLIYGWNGTGKTLLSRTFRSLEKRMPPAKGEVVLSIDGRDVAGGEFPHENVPVRVFNRDFVNDTVFRVGGSDIPPIYVIGRENLEKQKKVERLKAERAAKEDKLNAAREKKQQAERDLDKHCIDRAKLIKETLRLKGSAYNEYDKRNYQDRAQKMAADGDAFAHRLRDSQRESLLAQHRATRKRKVPEVAYRLPQLQDLADNVAALLGTTVMSAVIQTLKDASTLTEWTHHGLRLHKDRKSDKCLFCQQPLPKGRLAELDAHFNTEYERFLRQVKEQMQSLESARKQAAELRLPDRAALYDDLATEYDAAEQALRQVLDTVQVFLGELIKVLNNKKAQPFKASALTVSVPEVNTAVVDQLNEVIRRHNQACDEFDERVSGARGALALDMIAESVDEFVRLRDAVQTATAAIGPIENEIARFTDQITQLERDIKKHQRPAEELNEDLKRYLGHGELQLTIKDTGYSITRNGEPAQMLSEGEVTAIALLYFLKSLEDRDFDLQNGVVVLDDPVSSLDANALYCAFGFIRERTRHAGQLFILTHNFPFFRQVRNWFTYTRSTRLYMLECVYDGSERESRLRPLDSLLKKYESEYHYLFALVYKAATSRLEASLEQKYLLPNVARRLLETFLAFKYPDKEKLWKKLCEVKNLDESKKSRLFTFINMQSHGGDVGQPEKDLSWLSETRPILKDILDLIQSEDDKHFSAMATLVKADGNSGATNDPLS